MKFYFLNIINKLEKFSNEIDVIALLRNNNWVYINDETSVEKIVYIFRKNEELLISVNGKVDKSSWEYLGNGNLLIETNKESHLFKSGFLNKEVLVLKIDGSEKYACFVSENHFEITIKNILDLKEYLATNNEEENNQYSTEKIEANYVEVIDACPACNSKVLDEVYICPDCGLHFK
ncbi:hypothetical protein DVK85_12675 [Flavobacterium arcticum]|uniref:Uncharacterized protein n=1 Tax=Flavobacterium arcticum TaxID=1784713 RepID=A0A345HEM5_9FLAO|nr:hypothetical protein [Flavobacterium arcticum]AXG75035.1 hypothetical protein DVK85_12675 [Flavobacterium arcticum]KAF2511182.1 hypothetical protein E0W72_07265 [Flavobacterium arcticum]